MPTHLRHKPLLPRMEYLRRIGRSILIALALVCGSLFVGMTGYRTTEGMSWLDAFLNASMILAGMGPADTLHTSGGKLFAGCYAIFSGVIFITMSAVLMAPILHRFLHRFHLDITPDEEKQRSEE